MCTCPAGESKAEVPLLQEQHPYGGHQMRLLLLGNTNTTKHKETAGNRTIRTQ